MASSAPAAASFVSRPTPPLPPSPLAHLSFSSDGSCIVVTGASTAHWINDNFELRGLYEEKDAKKTIVLAAGNFLERKASTCVVVTRSAAVAGETRFLARRWKPGFLNYHWRYDEKVTEIAGADDVRAVRAHGDKTVVVHARRVCVLRGGEVLHQVETGDNPLGLCAVTVTGHGGAPFAFACPGVEQGEVHVERWVGEFRPLDIPAHTTRLACVAMSWDGRLVATASFRGTIVRVFAAADGALLAELRRGSDKANIHCIVFSPDSKWLAVSSDKGTVHVFSVNVDLATSSPDHDTGGHDLLQSAAPAAKANQQAGSSSTFSFLKGYLPGYFSSKWSLAQLRGLREGTRHEVAFGQHPNTVLVVGMDGSFRRCQFDPVQGGEMLLLEQRSFMDVKR